MTRAALALAVAFSVLLLAFPAQAATVAYGIAIGNDAPPAGSDVPLPTLAYADDDAVRYWQLFSRLGARTVLLSVLDEATGKRYPEALKAARVPSLLELRAVLAEYAVRMEADRARGDQPVLYLAFSGHGARGKDGALFLALTDAELTREKLYGEILKGVPASFVHLFIDACHAEGVVGARGILGPETDARVEPVTHQERQKYLEATTLAQFPHVGVVLATASDQQAHEWSQIESGVFTHELLSALTGAADVNGDGNVEYSEVQAFLAASNRDVQDERAVPHVIAVPPRVNPHQPIVALGWQEGAAQLAGASRLGHFFVELESGQRYLDAHLSFRLPGAHRGAGLAAVRGGAGPRGGVVPRPGEIVRIEKLSWRKRSVASRGAIEATLRRALFQSAYGPTYYRGYVDSAGVAGVGWDPSLRLTLESDTWKRPVSIGAFVVGAAALVAAGASTALGAQAMHDFEATSLQKPASLARERVITNTAVAAASGTVAVAALLTGLLLWQGQDDFVLTPSLGAGQGGAAVAGRW
ncbi:MAG: caspase family protein [Myxococcales bacterium]